VNMTETEDLRELSWLDAYRVPGCQENVIRVRFEIITNFLKFY